MSFSAPSRQRLTPALQLAGFVDILFLLLVFFLTASVFKDRERQVPISLYDAETAELSAEPGTQLVVTTTADGEVYLGPRRVSLEQLRAALTELAERFPDESLVLRGDTGSSYGLNMRIIDIARAAGIVDIQAATTGDVGEEVGPAANPAPPATAEP